LTTTHLLIFLFCHGECARARAWETTNPASITFQSPLVDVTPVHGSDPRKNSGYQLETRGDERREDDIDGESPWQLAYDFIAAKLSDYLSMCL
jgi:hypothetical protein